MKLMQWNNERSTIGCLGQVAIVLLFESSRPLLSVYHDIITQDRLYRYSESTMRVMPVSSYLTGGAYCG